MRISPTLALLALGCAMTAPAFAQEDKPEPIAFGGGNFTITETADFEKVLSFDGREIARDYFVMFDQTAEVAGVEVALFEVGPGGNACGPNTYIMWKPEGADLQAVKVGDDCGSPQPSLSGDAIHFVPYLMPGDSQPLQVWTPEEGLRLAGTLTFTPQPDTNWSNFDPEKLTYPVDAFSNADLFDAARTLLGDKLGEVTTGLTVSSGIERLSDAVFTANGCVPHACGVSDSFMAIDVAAQKLYFAQQAESGAPDTWPVLDGWPEEIRKAMQTALVP